MITTSPIFWWPDGDGLLFSSAHCHWGGGIPAATPQEGPTDSIEDDKNQEAGYSNE
jgi:hypothetical protein